MNTTVSGCLFKFDPPLSNGRNMSYVSREDDKAAECFELPEEIVNLEVEVYDFFLGNESSEPAWTNSSVSVPERKFKKKTLTINFVHICVVHEGFTG